MIYIIAIRGDKVYPLWAQEGLSPFRLLAANFIQEEDHFTVSLDEGYYFADQSTQIKIKEGRYEVYSRYLSECFVFYLYPKENDSYSLFDDKDFLMSADDRSTILLKDRNMFGKYLYYHDGSLICNSPDLFINGIRYEGQKLKQRDVVVFFSFSFTLVSGHLLIRDCFERCDLPLTYHQEEILFPKPLAIKHYILPERKAFVYEKRKEYKMLNRDNDRPVYLSVGQGLMMSLAMLMSAGVNYYYSSRDPRALTYLLIPGVMVLSGVLWPLLNRHHDNRSFKKKQNKNIQQYLSYLEGYKERTLCSLKEYKDNQDAYIPYKGHMFFLNKNNLMIPVTVFPMMPIDWEETEDETIIKKREEFSKEISHWEEISFLSFGNISVLTFLCQVLYRQIEKMIEILCLSFSYEEIHLALYLKEKSLYKKYYSIPHFFFDDRRLFLFDHSDLKELSELKTEGPLILICDRIWEEEIACSGLHIFYFTDEKESLFPGSGKRVVLQGLEKIDTSDFRKLPLFQSCFISSHLYSFRDINNGSVKNNYKAAYGGLRSFFGYGKDGPVSLDLHEKGDGPHGLIAGATGSGKSELIISLLLNLCMRYDPDHFNIILIDYKGGTIKDGLSVQGKHVPHLCAYSDNLEEETFERLMIALKRECEKREAAFSSLNRQISNIDDYNAISKVPIPHLLIVVDEFAQLKKQNPDMVKELISFARIGRSLGFHLLLSTQRPSGVIDEEIRSNCRYMIALKVFDERDSMDILGRKDAYYLKKPGEFYLKVDNKIIRGKAIYSKNDISQKEPYEVSLLDESLRVCKRGRIAQKSEKESSMICKEILEAWPKAHVPFKFKRKDPYHRQELSSLYNSQLILLGESDDYQKGKNEAVGFLKEENVLLALADEKVLFSVLNQLSEKKKQVISISHRELLSPCISDHILYEEEDKMDYFFAEEKDGITVLIEDVNRFLAYGEDYIVILSSLLKKRNCSFILGCSSCSLSPRIIHGVDKRFLFGKNKEDLLSLFSTLPDEKGDCFYENQKVIPFVLLKEEKLNEGNPMFPCFIPLIPSCICKEERGFLGYDLKQRKKIYGSERLTIISMKKDILTDTRMLLNEDYQYMNYPCAKPEGDILWIGKGLMSQNLFYPESREELEEGEGYLIKDQTHFRIKLVNHV